MFIGFRWGFHTFEAIYDEIFIFSIFSSLLPPHIFSLNDFTTRQTTTNFPERRKKAFKLKRCLWSWTYIVTLIHKHSSLSFPTLNIKATLMSEFTSEHIMPGKKESWKNLIRSCNLLQSWFIPDLFSFSSAHPHRFAENVKVKMQIPWKSAGWGQSSEKFLNNFAQHVMERARRD
jgi:hypothetical protein